MSNCERVFKDYMVRTIDKHQMITNYFVVGKSAQDVVNNIRNCYGEEIIEVFSADGVGLSAIEADDVWV